MIDFKPITLEYKEIYEQYLQNGEEHGCEYSFANLFLWGRQKAAFVDGQLVLFSQFSRRSVYPFPAGPGDRKVAVDAIIQDAATGKSLSVIKTNVAVPEMLIAKIKETVNATKAFQFSC